MKPISEIYPDEKEPAPGEYNYFCVSNYDPLLESMDYEILVKIDDEDYQGDSRLLLKDGDKIGYLQFGWGSCSGCDALQQCQSYEEIETLRRELVQSVKWFDNVVDALYWFEKHDWKYDYSNQEEKQQEFINKSIEWLKQ